MSEVQNKIIKFPAADGIRGLAVLIVVFAHALVMFLPETRPYMAGTGKIGVWLFFVLSAFLLTNKFIRTGLSKKSLIEYMFGRAVRILPMFFLASAFYYSFGYFDFNTLLKIVTFQEGYGHLWTIPVEFKFYFALPLILFFYQKLRASYGLLSLCTLTLSLIVFNRLLFPSSLNPENSISTIWYIPSFLIGVITSYLAQDRKVASRSSDAIVTLCLASIAIMIPSISNVLFGKIILPNLSTSYLSLSIAWGALIYFTVNGSVTFNKIFSSKIMRSIGNHSFSIYLFHWFFLTELSKLFLGDKSVMLLAIAASIISGWFIFKFIESPIEKLRHRIQKALINI